MVCLLPFVLHDLRAEVERRLQAIAHVTRKLEAVSGSVETLLMAMSETGAACDSFHRRYDELVEHRTLYEAIDRLPAEIRRLHAGVRDRFGRHEPIAIP